jgi:hypothetical protein
LKLQQRRIDRYAFGGRKALNPRQGIETRAAAAAPVSTVSRKALNPRQGIETNKANPVERGKVTQEMPEGTESSSGD